MNQNTKRAEYKIQYAQKYGDHNCRKKRCAKWVQKYDLANDPDQKAF